MPVTNVHLAYPARAEGGLDLVGVLRVVFPTSASRPTLFRCQQDFATSLSENTYVWLDFFLRHGSCLPLMHDHRSLDGILNPGGEVLETKSLSQLNRYWHSAAFSIALIALQLLCATPAHAEELASQPIGPGVLLGTLSVSRLTPPAPAQRDTPIHVRAPHPSTDSGAGTHVRPRAAQAE